MFERVEIAWPPSDDDRREQGSREKSPSPEGQKTGRLPLGDVLREGRMPESRVVIGEHAPAVGRDEEARPRADRKRHAARQLRPGAQTQGAQQLDETEQAYKHRAQNRRAVHVRPERDKRQGEQGHSARPLALADEKDE